MKTILITGGAGFVGAHLVERLIKDYHVVIVDNLKIIGGIAYVNPKAVFLHDDICDKRTYKKLNEYEFDAIYHLAAQSAGESAYDDPKYDILSNSYGTWMMANYCKEKGIKRFIYTSTVAVYGTAKDGGFAESHPIIPDSIYGVSKYSGELFIKQLLKGTKSQYTMFRIFNAYGPGENLNYRKKGMVSIYASYIWRNEPILVKGSLYRYRDYTYIEDVVDILYAALHHEKSYGSIYNLSTGVKTIVRDLLKVMIEVSGKSEDYEIIRGDSTPGDSFGTYAVVDKLKKDFNWSPKFSMEQGLRKYFQWINSIPAVDDLSPWHPLKMVDKKKE